jgi:Autoinducer binding domain
MVDLIAAALDAPYRSFEEANDHLTETARRSGVAHLSYWYLTFDGEDVEDVYWVSTYDPNYMHDYMQKCTPLGDPVIARVANGDSTVDWLDHPLDETETVIAIAAERRGISTNGMTIGFRPQHDGVVAFSLSVSRNAPHWHLEKDLLTERFRGFAQNFHYRMGPLIRSRSKGEVTLAV